MHINHLNPVLLGKSNKDNLLTKYIINGCLSDSSVVEIFYFWLLL